ncbi:MAG: hypothetical protein PXY39_04930 [archaeon]|nr:hypothetical protein [archaeon]
MSDSVPSAKRARTSAAILIAALIIFSSIAIIQSNLLQWPLSAEVHSLEGNRNNSQTNQSKNVNSDSSILVSAIGYLPSSQSPGFVAFPIIGAFVSVFVNASNHRVNPGTPQGRENVKGFLIASNSTGTNGQTRFSVPAGTYQVTLRSGVGNVTASLQTRPQNTTELDISVNDTSYSAAYFEIQNEASPGMLLPWESTFLRIDSNVQTNVNANESVYLEFVNSTTVSATSTTSSTTITTTCTGTICNSNLTIIGLPFLPQMISARLVSEFSSSSSPPTLWMQVQTNSVVNITNISDIDVLISLASYTLKQYPMTNYSVAFTAATASG